MKCCNCIHERVCFALIRDGLPYLDDKLPAEDFCLTFKNKSDVVESKAIEQIKWERDMAIKQLESYGVGFGEQADVVKVKHGYWEFKPSGHYSHVGSFCSVCGKKSGIGGIRENQLNPYCPNCGAKMDGKEPANESVHSK